MDDYGVGGGGSSRGLRRFFVFLRRFWWVPVLTTVLTIGAAIVYVLLTPPVFVSSATMWEPEKLHLAEGALFTEDSSTYIGTQIEVLKSGRMWQAAIESLRATGSNAVPLGKEGFPLPVTLSFKEAPKSAVFMITASSANAAYSQNFLNALLTDYLEYKKTVRKLVSGETAVSISAQVEARERELKAAQDALTSFQRTNNLAILQEEGAVAGGYLEKLQTELSDLQLESQLIQASTVEQNPLAQGNSLGGRTPSDLMKTLDSAGLSSPSPGNEGNERLTSYLQLEMLKNQRKKLSKVLRPGHPRIVALDGEIARGEQLLDLYRTQTHNQLAASLATVKMKMDSVVASIREWDAKVVESNLRIAEAERLKLDVARSQSVFDRLAAMLQNVDITRNTDLETLAIMEPASLARRSSKTIETWVLAVLGGLALGGGTVFLIEKRDDRFTSVVDVNATLGDAIVGLLPEVTATGKDSTRLLELNDSRHGYAESYRSLRSALLFLATDGERPKVLLITSAMPNEGKSTVAANLARTLALSGSSVLLVDGDLRKGQLHHLLEMQKEPGLAELLGRTCDPAAVIQRDSLPNLAFVSCGGPSRNPGDLFLESKLDEILAKWRREFDYVVIDSSPLFAADDASCLAPKVDGTLFVVRRGQSSARAVNEALDMLVQRQAKVLGVIFNGADASSRNYYYYKYAEYGASAKSAS